MGNMTELIDVGNQGKGVDNAALFNAAYGELKKLARARLSRSGPLALLDSTALVNEIWLRLSGKQTLQVDARRRFFAYAAQVMRTVIVDQLRERHALGQADIWAITSQPNGEGGNAISRATPCPNTGIAGGAKDFCGWEEMPGVAVRISVGLTAWVVKAQGQIFEWFANAGGYWQKRPGCFTDVAANGQDVYAVTCKRGNGDGNAIYRWNNAGAWVDVQGAGKRVAMDANSNAWAITEDGEIWRHEVR